MNLVVSHNFINLLVNDIKNSFVKYMTDYIKNYYYKRKKNLKSFN